MVAECRNDLLSGFGSSLARVVQRPCLRVLVLSHSRVAGHPRRAHFVQLQQRTVLGRPAFSRTGIQLLQAGFALPWPAVGARVHRSELL